MENTGLIEKALAYIQSSRAESSMTIDDVAFHAGFSTDYFNRIFQAHTGFSVMEYVRFTRLKRASILLRTTDRDILDIALDCGYEAHESFTRAFRKQYGKTPSEYRAYYADLPIIYADTTDDTAANRFAHEFPQFRRIDSTDAMDALLERDAHRFEPSAAEFYAYNGTRFFTDDADTLIAIDEFGKGNTCAEVITDDAAKAAQIWKTIGAWVKSFAFDASVGLEEIVRVFREAGVKDAEVRLDAVHYTGGAAEYDCTARDELTIRPLTIDDVPQVRSWAVDYGHDWKVEETVTQRDKFNNAPYDLPFGVFADERLIGVCRTDVYEYHGIAVGDMEGLAIIGEYKCRENSDFIFSVVLEELIARGYLPVHFASSSDTEDGAFDPVKFGFTPVRYMYGVYGK